MEEFLVVLVGNRIDPDSNRIERDFAGLDASFENVNFQVHHSGGEDFDTWRKVTGVKIENIPTVIFMRRDGEGDTKILKVIDPANDVTYGTLDDILFGFGAKYLNNEAVDVFSKKNNFWLPISAVLLLMVFIFVIFKFR